MVSSLRYLSLNAIPKGSVDIQYDNIPLTIKILLIYKNNIRSFINEHSEKASYLRYHFVGLLNTAPGCGFAKGVQNAFEYVLVYKNLNWGLGRPVGDPPCLDIVVDSYTAYYTSLA